MIYTKEDKLKHLEFIQNIVTRMASNSFILKGWSITLTSVIIGFALNSSNKKLIYLAFIPTIIFWGLDAYYLRQEKLFRELYHAVAKNDKKIPNFSLNTDLVKEKVSDWFFVAWSVNLMSIHLTMILLLIIISNFN